MFSLYYLLLFVVKPELIFEFFLPCNFFRLKLVLSVLIAVAAAAPGGYGYGAVAYNLAPEYHVSNVVSGLVPTATSSQSRVDYHSKPVITPIIGSVVKAIPQPAYAVHSAPLIHSAPLAYSAAWGLDAHAW